MPRYRFLLSFRWIVLTTLVTIAVLVMLKLAFWQVDRLHGRREANDVISSRQTSAPVPVDDLVRVGTDGAAVSDVLWRQVTITGTYKPDDQVLIRNRTNNTAPGFWVVTPIIERDGTAVAVNRGWVPTTVGDGGSPDQYAPPAGEVTVTGILQGGEHREGLEAADPATGKLTTMSRLELERLQQQMSNPLAPVWVQLADQQPPQSGVMPVRVTPTPLDDGPHLNYAGQWFIYAGLTVIVYPLAIRRAAKAREARANEAAAGPPAHEAGQADDAATAADEAPTLSV